MAIHKIKILHRSRFASIWPKRSPRASARRSDSRKSCSFSDGEFQPCYNESIRGCTVFIIQSTFPPSDNLMELLMMIDAARRASAHQGRSP